MVHENEPMIEEQKVSVDTHVAEGPVIQVKQFMQAVSPLPKNPKLADYQVYHDEELAL